MSPNIQSDLLAAAAEAQRHAYAPYSKYRVGAAVLTDRGEIYTGCNVENASYGLTICAERAAACAAVAAGTQTIAAVAIAAPKAPAPCGACRQFLAEFGADMMVLLVDPCDWASVHRTTLATLLPNQFRLDECNRPT